MMGPQFQWIGLETDHKPLKLLRFMLQAKPLNGIAELQFTVAFYVRSTLGLSSFHHRQYAFCSVLPMERYACINQWLSLAVLALKIHPTTVAAKKHLSLFRLKNLLHWVQMPNMPLSPSWWREIWPGTFSKMNTYQMLEWEELKFGFWVL